MILKKLAEAKTKDSDIELIKELKEKDSNLASLRDESITNIIRIFKNGEKEAPTADNISKWFNSFGTFGNFVLTFPENLSTYTISDFAEHEPKLLNAIRLLLKKEQIINDNDEDLTRKSDANETDKRKKLTPLEMCSIVFNYWAETKDRLTADEDPNDIVGFLDNGDAIYRVASKDLKDNSKFNREKFLEVIDKLDDAYSSLDEAAHICEKCGHSPCICEAEEEHEEEHVEEEPLNEIPEEPVEAPAVEEPHADVPESVFTDLINSAIQKEWDLISHINSLIATFDFEYKGDNKDDLASIFNQLVDDTTINIGMLHKAAELVSSKQAELMDAGEQKAEEIISEPAQDLE